MFPYFLNITILYSIAKRQLLCEKIYINLRFECKNREAFVNTGDSLFGLKSDADLIRFPVILLPLYDDWGTDGHTHGSERVEMDATGREGMDESRKKAA